MTAPSKFSQVFLRLLLLLSCVRAAICHAHCLCLVQTHRSHPLPGQYSKEVQFSLDGECFLWYNSDSNMTRPLGSLGEKVHGTSVWTDMISEQRELEPHLQLYLSISGCRTVYAKLCCAQNDTRSHTGAFWEFGFNEEPALFLNATSKNWTTSKNGKVSFPALKLIQENLENNKEYHKKILEGDYNHWLTELLKHKKKVQKPTELSNPQGPLAEEVNATNPWTELPQTQGERAREHRMNLSDISLEKNRTRDTLQLSTAWSAELIIGIAFAVIAVITILIVPGISLIQKCRSGAMKAVPSSDASSLDHDTVSELNGTLMTETDVDDNDTNLAGNLTTLIPSHGPVPGEWDWL